MPKPASVGNTAGSLLERQLAVGGQPARTKPICSSASVSTPLQIQRLPAQFAQNRSEIQGSVQFGDRPNSRRSMQPPAGRKSRNSQRSRSPNARRESRLYHFDCARQVKSGDLENQNDDTPQGPAGRFHAAEQHDRGKLLISAQPTVCGGAENVAAAPSRRRVSRCWFYPTDTSSARAVGSRGGDGAQADRGLDGRFDPGRSTSG